MLNHITIRWLIMFRSLREIYLLATCASILRVADAQMPMPIFRQQMFPRPMPYPMPAPMPMPPPMPMPVPMPPPMPMPVPMPIPMPIPIHIAVPVFTPTTRRPSTKKTCPPCPSRCCPLPIIVPPPPPPLIVPPLVPLLPPAVVVVPFPPAPIVTPSDSDDSTSTSSDSFESSISKSKRKRKKLRHRRTRRHNKNEEIKAVLSYVSENGRVKYKRKIRREDAAVLLNLKNNAYRRSNAKNIRTVNKCNLDDGRRSFKNKDTKSFILQNGEPINNISMVIKICR